MCSIPGLPTPGSEAPLVITRVNLNPSSGFVELWVNLDDGRKHVYERMREDIQSPERRFDGSEGKPGDLCLVRISDTWHRARIVSIQNEAYNVFLIDKGESHVAAGEAIELIQSDIFLLPPEIETCILANVLSCEKEWPEKASKFLKSLTGKNFTGLVQHVLMPDRIILLDIPVVSRHMCKCGVAKKVPGDEFKCLVLKHLQLPEEEDSKVHHGRWERNQILSTQVEEREQFFYPQLSNDIFETVIVSEVNNPRSIFCKLLIFSNEEKKLSEQIQEYYDKSPDFGETQPRTSGDPCAAKGLSGRWQRSQLKQNMPSDGAVEVLLVDEGKTELVPIKDIKPLPRRFLRMPVVTYPCSLDGVPDVGTGWTTDQNDYLKSLLLRRTVVARFDRHDISQDFYDVILYADNAECINSHFIEKKGLISPSKTDNGSNTMNDPIPSFLQSPEDQQCHQEQNNVCINGGLAEESLLSLEYREVKGWTDDAATPGTEDVHVKDGLEDPEPVLQSDGGQNEDKLLQTLMNVSSITTGQIANSHSGTSARYKPKMSSEDEFVEDAKTMGEQRKASLDVILEEKGDVLSETFTHSDYSDSVVTQLSFHSCPEGVVRTSKYKSPDVSLNKTEGVYASSIVGPNYFWCQFSDTEDLTMVSKLAQEAGQVQHDELSFKNLEDPGSPCLALFSVDNLWYRAQVIQKTNDTLRVLFIDYGKESDIDIKSVRTLPQSLLDVAPLAFLCSLNGFDTSKGSWDDKVYDDFYNLLVDKPLRLKVLNASNNSNILVPEYSVEIECENIVVNDALLQYWTPVAEGHVTSEKLQTGNSPQGDQTESNMPPEIDNKAIVNLCMYKNPNISKNQKVEAYASCIVGPHFFWCQYANTEGLNKVSRLAEEAGQAQQDNMFPETLGPGSPCLALFSADNKWYRVQIMNSIDNGFHVVFIDYGNESEVDIKDVRPLPQSLLDEAPQSFLCSLNGFDETRGSWVDEVYEDFYILLVDKPLRLTMVNMETHSEIAFPLYSVDIECKDVGVNSAMQKYWKPVAKERDLIKSPPKESSQTDTNRPHLSSPNENMNTGMYKPPNLSRNKTEVVYASCIVEPRFFWCQNANTEELDKVSRLAQEAGQKVHEKMLPTILDPGSPCLALFPTDNQWYRAQVIQMTDRMVHVLFMDYGNESDVDMESVRLLPQSLLDIPPQSFLCSLSGFAKSEGSWVEEVYEDFYNRLVDKPLRLTVVNMGNHSEINVPQYSVDIECNGVCLGTLMEKYWRGLDLGPTLVASVD